MRAVTQDQYGTPSVLSVQEVQTPIVGNTDVLVEVFASAVTQGDRRMRAADFPGVSMVLGRLVSGLFRPKNRVPGSVFAGRVAAVGPGVTRYAIGDDVFGCIMHGTQADFVSVPEGEGMGRMPEGMDYADAAALPYGAGTAQIFLSDLGQVKPGERVLVLGAAGGVGMYAVQIATHMGAEVTAVCNARDFSFVREQGAAHVIDYKSEDFSMSDVDYDVILDTPDASSFSHSRASLTATGRYLTLALGVRVLVQMAWTKLVGGKRAILGLAFGTPEHFDELRGLVEAGGVRPLVSRCFPLESVVQAHSYLEAEHSAGCVVLTHAVA